MSEMRFSDIKTEGIKYVGSKSKLIPHILEIIYPLGVETIFDGFAGTTRVSQALARVGYRVIANDIAIWSKVFATCYLLNKKDKSYYQPIIDYLNSLPPKFGWFSQHYGGNPAKGETKKPWQIHNTQKLDAIREEIDRIAKDEIEKSVLLTSLILALDRVDNTLGHFSSYLKKWSKRSYDAMVLKVPELIISEKEHQVYQEDIFNILPFVKADLAYYDPPYGSNNDKMPPSRVRYQAYYHIWTTIIKNDKPQIFGSASRRADTSDKVAYSPFEDFRKNEKGKFIASEAIEKLIKLTQSHYIVFSYSSAGRVRFEELVDIFSAYTKIIEIRQIDYKRNAMSYMTWNGKWAREVAGKHIEYLFLLRK